jgi:hypothetical protein
MQSLNNLSMEEQRKLVIDFIMKDNYFKNIQSIVKQNYINNIDIINNITTSMNNLKVDSPSTSLIEIIDEELQKEINNNIWEDSPYKDLAVLKANNRGNVGEKLIQHICDKQKIEATVDGTKTKKKGCDGLIKTKMVEIKTSVLGSKSKTFQHELGKNPWNSEYMIFVDVALHEVYITIFKNFTKDNYEDEEFKCGTIFNKKITCRDGRTGNYKLDTNIDINENCIKNGYCIKFDDKHQITFDKIGEFINACIN